MYADCRDSRLEEYWKEAGGAEMPVSPEYAGGEPGKGHPVRKNFLTRVSQKKSGRNTGLAASAAAAAILSAPPVPALPCRIFFTGTTPRRENAGESGLPAWLDGYTDIAGGISFRKKQGDRFRFKVMHKIYDYEKAIRLSHVCGCGRCDNICPEYISYSNCVNRLAKEEGRGMKNEYIPQLSEIRQVIRHTNLEYTFRMAWEGPVKPGQFFELSCRNTGKPLFRSAASGRGPWDFTIRRVGKVTDEIFENYAGDSLYLRGPYGNGFDLDNYRGKELTVIAGGTGLSPVKGVVDYFAGHPEECRSCTLIAGFKSPQMCCSGRISPSGRTGSG